MKNTICYNDNEDFEIPLFDFENSSSNKFAELYSEDNKTIVYKADSIRTVVLDSDIAEYFPNSKSVNYALRSILKAMSAIRNPKEDVEFL